MNEGSNPDVPVFFKKELGKGVVECWKVVSFLALEADLQAGLIGPAEEWFIKEGTSGQQGENYLYGVGIIYLSYCGFLWDLKADTSAMDALTGAIRSMLQCKNSAVWSVQSLYRGREWGDVRLLAQQVLDAYGLHLNPPKRPYRLENMIETDGYR